MNLQKTLLLCDDKSMNRKLVTAMLSGSPYEVIEAASGTECLHIMDSDGESVDIILLDISLKDINGIDVCKALRNIHQHAKRKYLPIIAYTANAMLEDRPRFVSAGFDEILTKPIAEEELLLTLERLLG